MGTARQLPIIATRENGLIPRGETTMSQDSCGQATSTQPTIEKKAPVAGQGDACSISAFDDGVKTFDPRTKEEMIAAGLANRQAQAKHALPEIEQCKPVDGQANPAKG